MVYRIAWCDIPVQLRIDGGTEFIQEVDSWFAKQGIRYMSLIGPIIPVNPIGTFITKCIQFDTDEDAMAFKLRWM